MIRFPKSNSLAFLVPAGTHPAICYCVAELGTQETAYGKKPMLHIGWELPDERLADGRPAVVSRRYAVSAAPQSALRNDIESWQGRRFSDIDLDTFDLADLVGNTCQVSIQHSDAAGGRIYANVTAVLPPARGMSKELDTHNDPIVFEFDDESARAQYSALPEFLQTAIARSPEYQEKFAAPSLAADEAVRRAQSQAAPAVHRELPGPRGGGPSDLDDDIPFVTCDPAYEPYLRRRSVA
jgi:hypothetical protein